MSNAVGDTLGGGFGNDHAVRIVTTYLEPAGSPYSGQIVVTSNDTSNATVLVPVSVTILTGVDEVSGVPVEFALHQNYPNPFNPTTSLRFDLPSAGHARLTIFDLLGRDVARLVDEVVPAGSHNVSFEASGLSSGVYFYRLSSQGYLATKKMLLLR